MSEAQAVESGHLEHASWLGQRQLHAAHIRLMQPSVRTAGSKPAILQAPRTCRADAEGKPCYVLQTSRNAWNRQKRARKDLMRTLRVIEPGRSQAAS